MGGSEDQKSGNKRPRSYYKKSMYKKRKKWNSVDVGMRGFLVTCNKNESQAVKEMYNLLNEYADKLYGAEQLGDAAHVNNPDTSGDEDDSEESEEDIEEELKKEVKALQQKKFTERRFQQVDSGTKNCLFIKTTVGNPCELIHYILEDVYETQIQKARFAMRVLPVHVICKANMVDITKSATDLFESFFSTPYGTIQTYGISFKSRMSSKVSRDDVIGALCRIIGEMNPMNKVNYSSPDLIVLVEVLRDICCLSVIKDFYKFRKYNLQETARAQQRLAASTNATTSISSTTTTGELGKEDKGISKTSNTSDIDSTAGAAPSSAPDARTTDPEDNCSIAQKSAKDSIKTDNGCESTVSAEIKSIDGGEPVENLVKDDKSDLES